MSPLPVEIVVKATVLLAAAGLLQVVVSHRGSAAARHLIWTLAIASLLVLPLASATLPRWRLEIPMTDEMPATATVAGRADAIELSTSGVLPAAAASRPAPAVDQTSATPPSERLANMWPTLIVAVYACGVLLLLFRLGMERFLLGRFARAAAPVTDSAWQELLAESARRLDYRLPVLLLRGAPDTMPLTFGSSLRRATIVIPPAADEWTEDRRRAVLLHELAHVARRDCLTQTMAAIVCAFYWAHPGVWWATRRLRIEGELACDDLVLAAGAEARDYAGHLLEIARSYRVAPAIALGMARTSQLEGRLLAVMDASRNRSVLRRAGQMVAATAALALLVPIATVRAALVPVTRLVDRAESSTLQTSTAAQRLTSDAPANLAGVWDLRFSSGGTDTVHLTLRTEHSSNGTTLPLTRLEGLTRAQISGGGTVHFVSRRDAGTFTFDGVCANGLCGGPYSFSPSTTFGAELARRGLGTPTTAQLYELAMADAGLALVDELKSTGYGTFTVETFVQAVEHGVNLEYVRGMAELGYRVGTVDALIRLRDHGVDPGYARGLTAEGLQKMTADELVRLRDHGVDPQYVRGMKEAGQPSLSIDQLVNARDHGVDPAYARGLAALGYKTLTLDSLVRLRDHGVDPEYVRGLASLGYKDLPADDLVRLRDHGVDAAFVRRLQERGSGHLSVDELIRRRDSGGDVDAYVQTILGRVQSMWQSLMTRLRS